MKRILSFLLLALSLLCLTGFSTEEDEPDHRFGGWVTKREATCTRTGLQFRYCLDCDHWQQRETKKLPHTIEERFIVKEPTCTQEGIEGGYCTVCGGYIRNKLPKLGHNYVATENTKRPPTCAKEGEGEMVCSRCGKKRNGKIPKLEHQWSEWTIVKMPSGNKRGTREHTCQLCGKTEKDYFHEEGSLYDGMKNEPEVIRLQVMLKDLGYYGGKIKSGSYGANTTDAVKKYQKKAGLSASGVATAETQQALRAAWEAKTGRSADEIDTAVKK